MRNIWPNLSSFWCDANTVCYPFGNAIAICVLESLPISLILFVKLRCRSQHILQMALPINTIIQKVIMHSAYPRQRGLTTIVSHAHPRLESFLPLTYRSLLIASQKGIFLICWRCFCKICINIIFTHFFKENSHVSMHQLYVATANTTACILALKWAICRVWRRHCVHIWWPTCDGDIWGVPFTRRISHILYHMELC